MIADASRLQGRLAGLFLTIGSLCVLHAVGSFSLIEPVQAQEAATLTREQADAQATYDAAVVDFKKIIAERRAQIDGKKKLPSRPGQALYLARVKVMSSYKDLTDVLPSRIGRPNKFNVPPAYFDAAIEPLIEQYAALFRVLQAPPANAQASATPFKDVVDIGTVIARAEGLDEKTAEKAGEISLGLFYAETNGRQNIGNARSKTYMGSLQTGVSENGKGARKWAAIKGKVRKLNPDVAARDDKEEARSRGHDQRYNHWTAVRNGLMNAHAELFGQIPEIVKMVPDDIDQMKLFELIQIIPTPTRAALASGDFENYRITDPKIMGYLRNNAVFTFGKKDRAKKTATYREILDGMWLFDDKFKRAQATFKEVKSGKPG
ncbi:MAG: hypothetical protein WC829_19810 [Hyphomicrobium sp.]|jgi:hypothetical protein